MHKIKCANSLICSFIIQNSPYLFERCLKGKLKIESIFLRFLKFMLTSNGLLIHKGELFNSSMSHDRFQVCNSTYIPFFASYTFHYFTIYLLRTLYSIYSSISYNHFSLLLLIIYFLLFDLLKIVIICFRGGVKRRRINRTILLIPAMMEKLKS